MFHSKAINLILSQSFLFSYLQLGFVSSKTRKIHRWLGTFLYSKSSRSEKISPFVDYYTLAKWALSSVHQQFSTLLFVPPRKNGEGGEAEFKSPSQRERCSFSQVKFHFILFTYHSNTSFHHKVNEQQNEWLEFAWEDFSFLTYLFSSFSSSSPSEQSLVTKKWNFSTLP